MVLPIPHVSAYLWTRTLCHDWSRSWVTTSTSAASGSLMNAPPSRPAGTNTRKTFFAPYRFNRPTLLMSQASLSSKLVLRAKSTTRRKYHPKNLLKKTKKTAATQSKSKKLSFPHHLFRNRRVWDLETGKCRALLSGHHGPVSKVSVLDRSCNLVTGSFDQTAKVSNN